MSISDIVRSSVSYENKLRLRHVYQIFAYNIPEEKKASYYFTLHNTPMSSPFYTSEKLESKNPKWKELPHSSSMNTNMSSVVVRVWKSSKLKDQIILTWGVNFSGLVYLGNKITDLQPKYFKANTVIFFMQGVYFTSQDCLRNDVDAPFKNNLNLLPTSPGGLVLYRRAAIKAPKGEIASSYTLDKLRKLQQLQRELKRRKLDVQNIRERIQSASERESKQDDYELQISSSSNIRFAPQLLTMNHLNKLLHEKPTKAERQAMNAASKSIETCRFRLRMLHEERDRRSVYLRKLKQQQVALIEENEKQSKAQDDHLMSLYHILGKESQHWEEYMQNLTSSRELLLSLSEQLRLRQTDLLKELLFIYPIDKLPNQNKYTMLGIHLPDSELLLDYQDAGVSVVLGYICHILIMCSIFLQVPLRHPVKHFGSRSVIYDQAYPDIPDKEREFPLYTKGRDRAHFSYAVFLLNKNISQLRWFMHRKLTVDLKETLKHLRHLLLGEDVEEQRPGMGFTLHLDKKMTTESSRADNAASLDKLISPSSLSSLSSSNLNDPLLDRLTDDLRVQRIGSPPHSPQPTPKKKFSLFGKSTAKKPDNCDQSPKCSNEVLAVPEAYLNRQISKDLFHRCASGGFKFEASESSAIEIREGVEIVRLEDSDSIEEGTDPLDPSANLDSMITKSIDIRKESARGDEDRFSRSMDSYAREDLTDLDEFPSDSVIEASKANSRSLSSVSADVHVGNQQLLKQWLSSDMDTISSNEGLFEHEKPAVENSDVSSPLTERTDRLLSTNQSFNLVKHRPLD
ncbi:hypothetical protein D910_11634 [Dendroctonus ponderosae]|uniref:C2 domain-containing protein n=1 Tax=Dendroctonus ponderosae TaxID=77166 RepID=U4UPF5_DENPD|nr:hypothetical protein D910_11634 [Dendroctonus ponderosae]